MLYLLLLLSFISYVSTNGYHQSGIPIDIDNQLYFVPFSTRDQYFKLCHDKNIHPADECAKSLEQKTLERLFEMESMYTKYQLLRKENIAMKQQNIILKNKLKMKCGEENENKDSRTIMDEEVFSMITTTYNNDVINININSTRNHRCSKELNHLPKEALEPLFETILVTGHVSEDTIISPIKMLKQLSSRNGLIHLLNDLGLNGEGAELGVHRGKFSEQILSIWNPPGRLHMIDVWEEIDNYNYVRSKDMEYAINRVKKFDNNRYNIVKKYTTEAALLYPNEYFDFIYLDASHTYESSRRDIQMWWPKLKRGGIFCGDDYINGNFEAAGYRFGVKDAVDEFASFYNLRVNVIWKNRGGNGPLPQWYIYKC